MSRLKVIQSFFVIFVIFVSGSTFAEKDSSLLNQVIKERISRIPELKLIRDTADKLGVQAFLLGGSSVKLARYMSFDLDREAGERTYDEMHFGYTLTQVFGGENLTIGIDGNDEKIDEIYRSLILVYPELSGIRIFSLQEPGDKEPALKYPRLKDNDNVDQAMRQSADSYTNSAIALHSGPSDSILTDVFPVDEDGNKLHHSYLNYWEALAQSEAMGYSIGENFTGPLHGYTSQTDRLPIAFIKDFLSNEITFFVASNHEGTEFFMNTSSINLTEAQAVVAAVQFSGHIIQSGAKAKAEDIEVVRKIYANIDWQKLPGLVKDQLGEIALNALNNAHNIENAWNFFENIGLKGFLVRMDGNRAHDIGSLSWRLNQKPLRSKELGTQGRTAGSLVEAWGGGVESSIVVSHQTSDFNSYIIMSNSPNVAANALIPDDETKGLPTRYVKGEEAEAIISPLSFTESGRSVYFYLDPEAREGHDFVLKGDQIIITNSRALMLLKSFYPLSRNDYNRIAKDKKAMSLSCSSLL